jgi:hypothetical protein
MNAVPDTSFQRIIAERLDSEGAVTGARTVAALTIDCHLGGARFASGTIEAMTASGEIRLQVSADPGDYQRVCVYGDNDRLLESLSYRNGYVVYEKLEVSDPG